MTSKDRLARWLAIQIGQSSAHPKITPMEHGMHLVPLTPPDQSYLTGIFPARCFGMLAAHDHDQTSCSMWCMFLSHVLSSFEKAHWGALLRVLRYLIGNSTQALRLSAFLTPGPFTSATLWSGSDCASDKNDRKYVSGSLCFLEASCLILSPILPPSDPVELRTWC